jgi:hypothetical protein
MAKAKRSGRVKTGGSAAALNAGAGSGKGLRGSKGSAKAVKLLAGGNPQIAKGHGEAPVRAYIAAMPGWKREVGERVDAIVTREVPGVRKAVKWNSPLYGAGDNDAGWFLGVHCFERYVKLAFFRGAELRPAPPGASKQRLVRYLDVREADLATLDGEQLAAWVRQASRLPGERM